jgi:hypothetical protein
MYIYILVYDRESESAKRLKDERARATISARKG